MQRTLSLSTLAGLLVATSTAAYAQNDAATGEVVDLGAYDYQALYGDGLSARNIYETMDVIDANGEEIGQVEDMIIDRDVMIIAVIAEVGGFWDIGDTHVSVPFDEAEFTVNGVVLPVTEENINDFTVFNAEYLSGDNASTDVVQQVDGAEVGPNFFRLSEVIGDYARVSDGDVRTNYGYVRDAIIRDGRVDALVVNPDLGYGMTGYRAYPYYGATYGNEPYGAYYDMPYNQAEAVSLEEFDYSTLGDND